MEKVDWMPLKVLGQLKLLGLENPLGGELRLASRQVLASDVNRCGGFCVHRGHRLSQLLLSLSRQPCSEAPIQPLSENN